MATRFEFESIYSEKEWVVNYPNAQGYQEKFLNMCREVISKTDFPNLDLEIEEYKSGGILFNKETTPMLAVSFKKSNFKKLGIFFRAQVFGNVVYYTLMHTVDRGFWDAAKGRTHAEVLATIRGKCKNWAQWEELQSLNALGSLVFSKSMDALDPDYMKNRQLMQVAAGN